MQVGVEKKVRSELHAWRQFLSNSSLWIAVLLFGSGVICWVAANWPALSNIQRFVGAQAMVAVSALGAAWTALRLRNAVGPDGECAWGALGACRAVFGRAVGLDWSNVSNGGGYLAIVCLVGRAVAALGPGLCQPDCLAALDGGGERRAGALAFRVCFELALV